MAQHDPAENSGATIFSHGSEWESTPEIVVFLFHTDNKPELEPPGQIQRLKSVLCHHVPVRGRRQHVLPGEREAEVCCQAVIQEEL